MLTKQDADQALRRLVAVWPVLKTRDGQRGELIRVLAQHKESVTSDELMRAIDLVLDERSSEAWPPGPGDLAAALRVVHVESQPPAPTYEDPGADVLKVRGKFCHKCGGQITYVSKEHVLHCPACNTIPTVDRDRHVLTPGEVHHLDLVEPKPVSAEEVAQAKADALAAIRGMKRV